MDSSRTGPTDQGLFPASLCHHCVHGAVVQGARSSFLKCEHPELARYQRQPVRECDGFTPREPQPVP